MFPEREKRERGSLDHQGVAVLFALGLWEGDHHATLALRDAPASMKNCCLGCQISLRLGKTVSSCPHACSFLCLPFQLT